MKYQVENGEPVDYKINNIYQHGCCSCGLQHLEFYDIIDSTTVRKIFFRNDYETKKAWQNMKKEGRLRVIKMIQQISWTEKERKVIIEALGGKLG